MTKANTSIVTKLGVAFVAVAVLFTMAGPAKAQTVQELLQLIQQLQAQIQSLQGSSAAADADYSFTRSLTVGHQGSDVTALQNYLIGQGYSIPAGATGYFGSQTRAAVAAWQAANNVAPAVGYFGPISIAKYNSLMAMMDDDDDDDGDMDGTTAADLSGEGSLTTVDMNNGDDTDVEEGDTDQMVADLDLEFANGDGAISRIDFEFSEYGNASGIEDEPWDTFETLYLYVDGEQVAEMDVDDEDDWLDEDNRTIRVSGLNIVGDEDDEFTVTVALDIASSVDGVSGSTEAQWTIGVVAIRFMDGDGVVTTDTSTGDLTAADAADDGSDPVAKFDISEEGGDDELKVTSSPDDPDPTTLEVDTTNTSDWYEIFVFDAEADEDGADIVIDNAVVSVVVSTTTFDTVVDDARLVIGGTVYDDFTTGTDADGNNGTDAATVNLNFDLDKDVEINSGDEEEFSLRLKFKKLTGNYDERTTVQGKVTSTNINNWDAEGADDLTTSQLEGSATGETHTLQTEGISYELTSITETKDPAEFSGEEDSATFVFTFEVTAVGNDFYFDEEAAGIDYDLLDDGATTTAASSTAVLDISGADDASTADFVIFEGETATFTYTVETNDGVAGAAKVRLNTIYYEDDDADVTTADLSRSLIPTSKWTSDSVIIN